MVTWATPLGSALADLHEDVLFLAEKQDLELWEEASFIHLSLRIGGFVKLPKNAREEEDSGGNSGGRAVRGQRGQN